MKRDVRDVPTVVHVQEQCIVGAYVDAYACTTMQYSQPQNARNPFMDVEEHNGAQRERRKTKIRPRSHLPRQMIIVPFSFVSHQRKACAEARVGQMGQEPTCPAQNFDLGDPPCFPSFRVQLSDSRLQSSLITRFNAESQWLPLVLL